MPLRHLWRRLLRPGPPATTARGRPPAPAIPPGPKPIPGAGGCGAPAGAALSELDDRGTYLCSLLAVRAPAPHDRADAADLVLAALDAALDPRVSCDKLLRRAPDVLPRLINSLRDHNYARTEVARHIERDALLTAEVLRMARSTLFAHLVRGAPTVPQAIDLLGRMGLKQVIARVLLRPLLSMDAGGLQLRAAARIWDDAERCAVLSATVAPGFGVDPGDAYLAGLLLTMGWSAALRALEIHGAAAHLHADLLQSPGMADALYRRRDRIVARLLPAWDVSPGLTRMAHALGAEPGAVHPPLLALLPAVEHLVRLQRLGANGDLPPPPQPGGGHGLQMEFVLGAD